MLLLALSTSTDRTSVALARGALVLTERAADRRAGDVLFALLDEALAAVGADRREIRAIACDVGPGSFTGVRVGVSVAKTLAFSLGAPAYGVSSLRALAALEPGGPTFAVLDAGRGERYSAAFDGDRELAPPEHRALDETEARAAALGLRVVGQGLAGLAARPDATLVLRAALPRALAGDAGDELEPLYLRPPDVTQPKAPAPRRDASRPPDGV